MTRSELNKSAVWHPFTQAQTSGEPLFIARAKDTLLFDDQGNSYIDINSSWWVNVHGHANPRIAAAISEQFQEVDHVIFAGATHEPGIQLATEILKVCPTNYSRVFFSDDGSTAVEVALKMAFQYWHNQGTPKSRILALEGAYHGDTFGAMSVGERGYFNKPFEPFFFHVDYLEFPFSDNRTDLLKRAEELFRTGEFAAIILEPLIQGSAGMRMYEPEWLEALIQVAKSYNVLVIVDEIMTGWGRTGKLFAMDHCGIDGDIKCVSKGLTGGVLPLGLTITTEDVYKAFLSDETGKALLHGHSFTGNPLACAAAVENLRIFSEPDVWHNIERISNRHAEFAETLQNHSEVTEIKRLGTILRFEIVDDSESRYFSKLRQTIVSHYRESGVFLRPLGNTIFFNPPYCITDVELDQVYQATLDLLHKLSR